MMDQLVLNAYAKINLGLDVLSKRTDGYHNIRTIMQSVDLADRLCFERSKTTSLKTNAENLSCGDDNIVTRCVKAMQQYCNNSDAGLQIELHKEIPMQAGLGGGSADGAATIYAFNKLYRLGLDQNKLMEIGAQIGADIPFMIRGGIALCEGIGEMLSPITINEDYIAIIVKPTCSISTKEAYEYLDNAQIKQRPSFKKLIEGLDHSNQKLITENNLNVFEQYATTKYPELDHLRKQLWNYYPLSVSMSGSGSAYYALYQNKQEAEYAFKEIKKNHPNTYYCNFRTTSIEELS